MVCAMPWDVDTALDNFQSAEAKGLIHPDVVKYNSMDKANELMKKMEENGCLPNDLTYSAIVRGFLYNKTFQMRLK
jgi:pentatricopeptide repeat protein